MPNKINPNDVIWEEDVIWDDQPQPMQQQQQQPMSLNDRMRGIAGAISPYARPALEAGGALGGALLAAPGNVIAPGLASIGGAGLGYAAGKQTADLLDQYAGLQKSKGIGGELLETAIDIPTGAAMEAAGGIIGKPIGSALKYAGKLAPRVYEAVAKFRPSIDKLIRNRSIKTALENEIPITKKGIEKIGSMIEDTNNKIAQTINNAKNKGDTIKTRDILNNVKNNVTDWAKKSYENTKPIINKLDEYIDDVMKEHGETIPVEQAQKLKSGIYRRLKDNAFLPFADDTAKISAKLSKEFAGGVRKALIEQYPQLEQLGMKDRNLIELEKEISRAVSRTRNRDIMGLAEYGGTISGAELAGGPGAAIGAIATKVFRSPAVMSQLSFALAKVGKKAGMPILQRAIGYPIGKAAGVTPDQAEQAIGDVMGAMATPAQASGNIPQNVNSPFNPQPTPTPSRLTPDSNMSLGLYRDAQKAYLAGNYDEALTYFKQLLREDPKRSIIYKKAIDQINAEKEGVKNFTMNRVGI
jgi:TolA-binding protein/ElaB/YqjD/DUF883 family membrane-anchored ribosome-binding protein